MERAGQDEVKVKILWVKVMSLYVTSRMSWSKGLSTEPSFPYL